MDNWADRITAALTALTTQRKAKEDKIAQLQAKITENSATMKTIAGMFSNTVWNLLPGKIKAYFAEWRN